MAKAGEITVEGLLPTPSKLKVRIYESGTELLLDPENSDGFSIAVLC